MVLQGGGVGAGQPKFQSLEALVAALGGKRVLRRVLIANNGIAALKGIMSMRHWAYEMLGNENAIQFVCMATPEDISVNVEYIKMADETVEVPGGRNSNNYANVQLIIETARKTGCDAVWAGWGHASENPALPEGLRPHGIMFLGPEGRAMHELGDKIASSIVAQTAGVPTIAWSGSGLSCTGGSTVPKETFEAACVRDARHCIEVCQRLHYPLMIKASEGGGGKGIRTVKSEDEVVNAYHAAAGEVPGSPIFVMRLAGNVRHLEVQLLADEHGEVMSLRTRDCSVQRRHQKIIEEGPCVRTIPGVLRQMEEAAVRLAKLVGYRGVGTVEYLYDKEKGTFYFLELNPRLQVEHTVTELITGVNLPACMLLVGMGVPLHRIPDIRAYCGDTRLGTSPIDFATKEIIEPQRHTIACRITAENPEDGFTPTTGAIDELTFRNSKQTWGYFSVSSHGGVHEYADSQFGHIFSTAGTRDDAIAGMVLALKQLTIRGEIRSNKEYLLKLLDMPAFKESDISTTWLDGLIRSRMKVEAPNPFLSVLCAATYKAVERFEANRAKYLSFLEAGHVPSNDLISTKISLNLVLDQVKYEVACTKSSASEWVLTLCGTHIEVGYRRLADRGLLVILEGGRSPVVYAEEDAACLRVTIDGRTATFTHESDPTKLRSQMPGKLVRYLVKDGDCVEANTAFCEIEVMKMYLQLKTSLAGTITLVGQPGTTVHAGKILARVEPSDPDSVVRAEENQRGWPPVARMWSAHEPPSPTQRNTGSGAQQLAQKACERSMNLLMGYDYPRDICEPFLTKLPEAISAVASAEVSIGAMPLPWLTKGISDEQLRALNSPLAGQERLVHAIKALAHKYLDVETLYEGGKLQQEVVDSLRSSRQESGHLEEVFDIELSRRGLRRHRVIAQLLKAAEAVASQLRPTVQRMAALSDAQAGMVVFAARHMLRKIDMPPAASRQQELREALADARGSPRKLAQLADQLRFGTDVISSCLLRDSDELLVPALELFLRRIYAGVLDIRNFHVAQSEDGRGQWLATWLMQSRAKADNPLKHEGISGTMSHDELASMDAPLPSQRSGTDGTEGGATTEAQGVLGIFEDLAELEARIHRLIMRCMSGDISTVLEIVVREESHTHGVLATEFERIVLDNARSLQSTDISRVTFVAISQANPPRYYTFRKSLGYKEDSTYRHIAPTLAYMLELPKLRNYDVELYQGNPIPHVHVYFARERAGLRKGLPVKPRLFVRTLVLPSDVSTPGRGTGPERLSMFDAERVVADCIHALEIATADRSLDPCGANHVFLSFEGFAARFSDLEMVVNKISELHGTSFYSLGVVEIEVKIRCTGLTSDSENQAVPMRVFIRNPTTHALELESYIEVEDSQAPHRSVLMHLQPDGTAARDDSVEQDAQISPALRRLGSSTLVGDLGLRARSMPTPAADEQGSMHSGGDDSNSPGGGLRMQVRAGIDSTRSHEHGSKRTYYWHHQPPLAPYPLLTSHQARRLTAVAQNTIYCYDWVVLFDKAVRQQWELAVAGRTDLPELRNAMPRDPLVAREVVFERSTGKLREVFRAPGENRCAMVGWRWALKHPSHYNPETGQAAERVIFVVANDITLQSGSFSTEEDELFAAVCRAARQEGVPLVYLSANSGARIGLDGEVKKVFKIKQSSDPGRLFDYLYLDDDTKQQLEAKGTKVVETEPVVDPVSGQVHHKLTAVVGAQWGLGVENLSGSGLIAGEMAKAYEAIPTISVATGRTVGIGAYLVRLGRRVVQTRNSPIILTGNAALNKLLGKEVYTSNNQLGGTNIMGPNGVSHWVVDDDMQAVHHVMQWLDFVPDVVNGPEHRSSVPPTMDRIGVVSDPVDRDVEQATVPSTPYDVRTLVNGTVDNSGKWTPGLFDFGSFQESLSEWAKTVIVGRAKLGGIPVGVICVEARAINKFNPADPADPTSVSAMHAQAGMVWYPDSARKTADHLADLQREKLPCIILANWRGFSGGMRDMFDEVLKFGADIVQNLTAYTQPVFVYIPPHAELRGGAWVVIDPRINRKCIEMYVDPSSRGGVLEPEGIVEIKFREKEILQTMDRLDPECQRLAAQLKGAEGQLRTYLEQSLRSRHEVLFPVYKAVAVEFADLHDRPGRMAAVGSIDGAVPWKDARRFLYWRLRRRVCEFALREELAAAGVTAAEEQTRQILGWFERYAQGQDIDGSGKHPVPESASWEDDKASCGFYDWIFSEEGGLASALRGARTQAALHQIEELTRGDPALADILRSKYGSA
eukprot:TRINITY_DN19789_c0_g2_i1.p1 TRINITY_DN19789_c0_g2~~TRINITY_DN19789_c0_g2_i1.p1  ORF type:complete len:2257 (+),score=954.46 TRINITY_DN19789_c0_g2_i1:116-6886(+)